MERQPDGLYHFVSNDPDVELVRGSDLRRLGECAGVVEVLMAVIKVVSFLFGGILLLLLYDRLIGSGSFKPVGGWLGALWRGFVGALAIIGATAATILLPRWKQLR